MNHGGVMARLRNNPEDVRVWLRVRINHANAINLLQNLPLPPTRSQKQPRKLPHRNLRFLPGKWRLLWKALGAASGFTRRDFHQIGNALAVSAIRRDRAVSLIAVAIKAQSERHERDGLQHRKLKGLLLLWIVRELG